MAQAAERDRKPDPLVSQDVQWRLKQDILDGRFAPGEKLGFAQLQRQYGAGVGTLREALSHLLPEGLVDLDARRGFRVSGISAADLIDVSSLYVELERRAATDSVRHGDHAWETGVLTSFHDLARIEALPREERIRRSSEWLQLHRAFHLALVASCRSRWLLHMRALMFDHMERYRLISQKHRPLAVHKRREHRLIRDAALARRADEVAALLTAHLEETTETVLRHAPQFMPGDS